MACNYGLNPDGALLVFQDVIRFSLMTFDQDPSAGTGVTSGAPYSVLNPPFDGMWSYFLNWGGGGAATPALGNPVGCLTTAAYEVGARNPAAPPWEGRMVPFSPPDDADGPRETQNQQLRSILSATRPYGGTPIAGMFDDARTFLWNDPNGPGKNDPSVACPNGRKQFIILLTDGAPNLDLRPSCDPNNVDGVPSTPCPYNQPETVAQALLTGGAGHQPIETFVIGFAVSSGVDQGGTLVQCSQLDPNGTQCTNPTPSLAACCKLDKIAVNGQPPTAAHPHAYFVDTPGDLQKAISDILATIAGSGVTTRTLPSYSTVTANIASSGSTNANQSTFNSFFYPASTTNAGLLLSVGNPWHGDIQRSRFLCSAPTAPTTPVPAAGDDFAQNLGAGGTRHFIAFQPASPAGRRKRDHQALRERHDRARRARQLQRDAVLGHGDRHRRDDHPCGAQAGTRSEILPVHLGDRPGHGLAERHAVRRHATRLHVRPVLQRRAVGLPLRGTHGRARVRRDLPRDARCHRASRGPSARRLVRSVPHVASGGPPGMGTVTPPVRDTIVYAATTDGLLHAFWADQNQLAQNEEWALLPPAVMPQLLSSYPGANLQLLDGTPVVKDVICDPTAGRDRHQPVAHDARGGLRPGPARLLRHRHHQPGLRQDLRQPVRDGG